MEKRRPKISSSAIPMADVESINSPTVIFCSFVFITCTSSGYVKQRALGYEPKAVPPDALFVCLERLGELADKASSPELDTEIRTLLKQITAEFLLPEKG